MKKKTYVKPVCEWNWIWLDEQLAADTGVGATTSTRGYEGVEGDVKGEADWGDSELSSAGSLWDEEW